MKQAETGMTDIVLSDIITVILRFGRFGASFG
jgi:hypothetical protein